MPFAGAAHTPPRPLQNRTITIDGQTLSLAFSDEFDTDERQFGWGHDARWEAADYSVTGDAQCYQPEMVTTKDGSAVFTFERNTSFVPSNNSAGCEYRSARLQSWNKVCFTGGYLEARIKLPGTSLVRGLKAAFSLFGNLGRVGYPDSLDVRPRPALCPPAPHALPRVPSLGRSCRAVLETRRFLLSIFTNEPAITRQMLADSKYPEFGSLSTDCG